MAELTPGQIACAGYCWGEELERFLEQIPIEVLQPVWYGEEEVIK